MKPEIIALYLPQYHPIRENDEWWEPGFTEWTNVTKAKPLYRGHYQPNLPSELGFYDLRLSETREAQATLAKAHSVAAFCYYHYWFGHGRRLLERPLADVLALGKPDFPFMVCWANQTWSGVWHGLDKRILAEQTYPGPEDEKAHFEALLPAFRDPRYLQVNGKPVFMVYDPDNLPDSIAFTNHWRQLANEAGLPGLYLLAEYRDPFWNPKSRGFDAFVLKPSFLRRRTWTSWRQPAKKIYNKYLDLLGRPSVFDYEFMQSHLLPELASPLAIPCVLPNWDNTPRSGARGVVLEGSTPQKFALAIDRALALWRKRDREDNFIFVKSWNEWAEGNHLEPSRRWGRAYLEVLATKLRSTV